MTQMGILYVVATPIGNLGDLSTRAKEILASVELILAEDTRRTRQLLTHFEIKTPTARFDDYALPSKIAALIDQLSTGAMIALVTDAGTPAIQDPGSRLVDAIHQYNQSAEDPIRLVPIPGPAAVTTLLSVAGCLSDRWLFVGFLPKKKGRQTYFNKLKNISELLPETAFVIYESPYRIRKTLADLATVFPASTVVIGRELTKQFEQIWRGPIEDAPASAVVRKEKGEYAIALLTDMMME